jgi:hypothetical protein
MPSSMPNIIDFAEAKEERRISDLLNFMEARETAELRWYAEEIKKAEAVNGAGASYDDAGTPLT